MIEFGLVLIQLHNFTDLFHKAQGLTHQKHIAIWGDYHDYKNIHTLPIIIIMSHDNTVN